MTKKCACIRATARNTSSVRNGSEVSGYVKHECANCREARNTRSHRKPAMSHETEDLMGGINDLQKQVHDLDDRVKDLTAKAAAARALVDGHLKGDPHPVTDPLNGLTPIDWRAMYRFQTAMRYMDNNPSLTRARAYEMAAADIFALETIRSES